MLETDDINGNIKVIDFNTSRIFHTAEKMCEITGTVIYIYLLASLHRS